MLGLLEKSNQLIPGLEKVIALYFDNAKNQLQCKGFTIAKGESIIEDFLIADLTATQKLRTRKIQFQWMSANHLPFETEQKAIKQLNIFDELNNVVLCLGFKNSKDQLTDLLFLYLNHNKGNFGKREIYNWYNGV